MKHLRYSVAMTGPRKGVTVVGDDGIERALAAAGLVDAIEVAVMPVLLGSGIPVLSGGAGRVKLRLVSRWDRIRLKPDTTIRLKPDAT